MRTLPADDPWAVTEFAEAELGDLRRTQRLVEWATVLAQRPGASLPEACGDRATRKAASRFFDKGAIEPQNLLDSHVDATLPRLAAVPLVLAVQETTELDWTAHPATTGVGPLGHSAHQGLHVHTTLAFTPARLPLGLLAQQGWARDPEAIGKRATRKQRAITEKESQQWLTSVDAVFAAHGACPQTHCVSVGDREADVYDLLARERPPGVDLLIRAAWDRCVTQPAHSVWATVAACPVEAISTVQVPRRGAQPPRTASLAVRWCPLTRCPPRHRKRERLPTAQVWAVQAREETPPAEADPIAWLVLTPGAVQTTAEALERLDWSACRWGGEVWQSMRKSGCRIDARQWETAERLQRCLPLYRVIAWRIFSATMLSRVVPEAPCPAILAREEWQALSCAIPRTSTPPPEPPSLRQAVHWMAQLGGFVGRRGDGEPGATVLWKGVQHLTDLTTMSCIMRPPPAKRKNVGKT